MPAASDIGGIPDAGKGLIVVAVVDHALHFRIFDGAGKVVADVDEKKLLGHTWQIQGLKKQLESLWPPHDLTRTEKSQIIGEVTSITGYSGFEEWQRTQNQIAALVGELRAIYPDDPRVAHYLRKRWESLNFTNKRDFVHAEIREILRTTTNPALRNDALFIGTCLRFMEPIDGAAAVSMAESFARQAPRTSGPASCSTRPRQNSTPNRTHFWAWPRSSRWPSL